jgi:uncharacterized protein
VALLSNIVGFDDAPFAADYRGQVPLVGAVYASTRFDGVLIGSITRDGDDATDRIASLLLQSRFAEHARAVMLQGVTFGGFNVVDVRALHERLGKPVLVVARKQPDMDAIRNTLCTLFPDGGVRYARLEQLGPMQPMEGVFAQWAGTDQETVAATIRLFAINGLAPEPIRVAHLIAGALPQDIATIQRDPATLA